MAGTKRIAREEQAGEETALFDLKQTKKRRHLTGMKTLTKMVCEGFMLADTESEWWSPETHFRRKLVGISVTPVGVCTSGRKLNITVGMTLELCSVVPRCRLRNYYRAIFIFSFSYWGHHSVAL